MRLNKGEQLGLQITEMPSSLIMREIWEGELGLKEEGLSYIGKHDAVLPIVRYALTKNNITSHFLTERAIEVIDHIHIPDKLDIHPLNLNKRIIFNVLFGKDRVLRICWEPAFLFVAEIWRTGPADVFWQTALCSTGTCHVINKDNCEQAKTLKRALRFLIFLKYTEPELLFVGAGKKRGTRKQGYYNDSPSDITIVDSTWNKFIIRTEGFGVTGHFRLQPHGEKNQQRKLIWIQPFEKHGYVRRPKSQTINA